MVLSAELSVYVTLVEGKRYLDEFVTRWRTVDDGVGSVPGQHGPQPVGAARHGDEHESSVGIFVLLHQTQCLRGGLVCGRHADVHAEAQFTRR